MGLDQKSYSVTKHVAYSSILPELGDKLVSALTPTIIRQWHENLATQPARIKSRVGFKFREQKNSQDVLRQRKATANRRLTVLKAALNLAWRDGLVTDDEAWRKVKPFRNVDAPKIRFLSLAECERLINACGPNFRSLVRAALLTGCRYSELTALKTHDFNADNQLISITHTKSGKPRHVPLTEEGQQLFLQATAGKLANETIFTRNDGKTWGKAHQIRRLKDACNIAKIEPAVSFHILRHTYGSLLASKGVPLQVIAELLGHADTRITSRHYAHLLPSYVADTLRANLPEFIKTKEKKSILPLIKSI